MFITTVIKKVINATRRHCRYLPYRHTITCTMTGCVMRPRACVHLIRVLRRFCRTGARRDPLQRVAVDGMDGYD